MKLPMQKLTGIEGWVSGSITHKRLIFIFVAAAVVAGIGGLFEMKKDEFPTFDIKQGLVAGVYPGATAEQVETQLTKPLEEILFSIKEIDRKSTRSVTEDGICYIYVDLNCPQSKKDEIWSKIKLKLEAQKSTLPSGVLAVAVLDDFNSTSSLLISLSSDDKGYGELQDLADDLCKRLRRIPELASVTRIGERTEEVAVTLDREKLSSTAINPTLLMLDYQSGSIAIPGGNFSTDYTKAPIHITSPVVSEQEVAEKVIWSDPTGNVLRLKDVAKVERRLAKADNFVSYNGHPCIILSVVMRSDNNIVAFGKEVDKVLSEFEADIPQSLVINRITDQPKVVGGSVFSFLRDLVISMLVVIFVMLMLFPMKSALIASSGVPVCTAIAILLMFICGMEVNTVTLAALIVCLGMIVDDSIITMDGYMDKLERGMSRTQAACASAKELFLPTFVATLAICLMFFPMTGIITGYLGDFVKLFPWVITFALMISLFYAVTVVPSLETRYITNPRALGDNFIARAQNVFFNLLEKGYAKMQGLCFRHPAITIGLGFVTIAAGVLMFLNTNIQMMPKAARDHFVVEMELEAGNGIDRTKQLTDSLQSILQKDERVSSVTAFVGTGAPRFNATYAPILPGPAKSQLIVNTISAKATEALLMDYESKYEHLFPEAIIRFKQMDYQAVDAPVIITLKGASREQMMPAADSIKKYMASMDTRLKWVHSTGDNFRPTVNIDLKPEESSTMGVNKGVLSLFLLGTFNGQNIANIWEGETKIPVNIYTQGVSDTMSYSVIGDQMVPTSLPGVCVPLRQVADITPAWEPASLERCAGEETVSIMADMKYGEVQPAAVKQIKSYIDKNIVPILPQGCKIEYRGLTSINNDVIPQIVLSFLAAVAVLFIFLLVHFRKLSLAVLTMAASTLCLFGASLGLWIFKLDFGLTAVLGLISLVGIIVRNGIILFEYAESLRTEKGMSAKDAAEEAGKRRMRPIFLTSCTTALGVLPMIISGDLLWQPMGVVICFGIVLSIFLIVLIMPVSYWLVFNKKKVQQ